MIWFTVLRSYKDAHAKKIVQRILNGTDKDRTTVSSNLKKRMQRFWTDVNNTPPPTRLGEFIPVTQKYVVKMRDRANGKHAV